MSPAVTLAIQLDLSSVASQPTLAPLLEKGFDALAETLAEYLGRGAQEELAALCSAAGQHKSAYRVVSRFGLEQRFPDAKRLYNQSTLRKLAQKGAWEVAAAWVGENGELRRMLFDEAVAAGQARRALTAFSFPYPWGFRLLLTLRRMDTLRCLLTDGHPHIRCDLSLVVPDSRGF